MKLTLNQRQYFDCLNLADGLFSPVKDFMNRENYWSVISTMKLVDGSPWIYPISLDIQEELQATIRTGDVVDLEYEGCVFGQIRVTEKYEVDNKKSATILFGTCSNVHPGVAAELSKPKTRIAGSLEIDSHYKLTGFTSVTEIKKLIRSTGAKSFVGFQTRNPPHRAHEYIHRNLLELFDGLLINPLTGWKKAGDFSEEAVMAGYKAMIDEYYKGCNIIFKPLKTAMLYAGPKEAIHHALLRRNMGCTHFVVGRDHAGVGNFYGNYEAHDFVRKFQQCHKDLGIQMLLISEPVFCKKCGHVVSERSCGHQGEGYHERISGSQIRASLKEGKRPSENYIRPEVTDALISLPSGVFVEEDK